MKFAPKAPPRRKPKLTPTPSPKTKTYKFFLFLFLFIPIYLYLYNNFKFEFQCSEVLVDEEEEAKEAQYLLRRFNVCVFGNFLFPFLFFLGPILFQIN